MDIKHGNNKFFIEKDSEEVATLSYIPQGDVLTIVHTGVSDDLSGQGIGQELVSEAVQYARTEGKKIDPQCPFARNVIEKNPTFQDVLQS